MNTPSPAPAEFPHLGGRLLWLAVRSKQALSHMVQKLDLGFTSSTAYQIASEEIDRLYEQACLIEGVPAKPHMLELEAVKLQARFALDAALHAAKHGLPDGEVRKQFWATFAPVTNSPNPS